MSDVSESQLAAFHATHYRVDAPQGPFVLRIGQYSPALHQLHDTHHVASSAFLTAWNPLGKTATTAENAENQLALRRDLARDAVPVMPGEGRDPATGWAEQSLLAIGLSPDQATALGNRYRQLAVVFAGADAVPRLILLR